MTWHYYNNIHRLDRGADYYGTVAVFDGSSFVWFLGGCRSVWFLGGCGVTLVSVRLWFLGGIKSVWFLGGCIRAHIWTLPVFINGSLSGVTLVPNTL